MSPFIITGLLLALATAGQIAISHRRSAHRRAIFYFTSPKALTEVCQEVASNG